MNNTIPRRVGYLLAGILLGASLYLGNIEFVWYGLTVLVLVAILHLLDKQVVFKPLSWWLFNLWLVLHITGGLVQVGGEALYSLVIWPLVGEPYHILKYDQLVHWYCYLVVALLLWQILCHYMPSSRWKIQAAIVVLAAAGVGALNEVVEFAATIAIAEVNVGGYTNTMIDIVANFAGALSALSLIAYFQTHK